MADLATGAENRATKARHCSSSQTSFVIAVASALFRLRAAETCTAIVGHQHRREAAEKGVCTRKLADTAYLLPARASSIVLLPALAWGEGWNIIWGRARNVQGFRRRSRCDRRRRSGPIRATLEHAQSGRSDASPTAYGAPAIFSRSSLMRMT